MANLTPLEKRQIEDLLGMSSGYVGSFSNSTFGQLIHATVGKDIFDEKYNYGSGSKANRFRSFWDKEPDLIVGKVLKAILDIWEYENDISQNTKAYDAYKNIVSRLLGRKNESVRNEDEFLKQDFGDITLKNLPLDSSMILILEGRLMEAFSALNNNASLSVIFMCGSILEGALLGIALKNPKTFNTSNSAPKDKEGRTRQFQDWSLGHFIDVSCEVGLLKIDIKKFSHSLRDFRNYIHPYMQMASGFNPDLHTAKICMQVLKAAIADLSRQR
ncbi:MAG: hypothetical protein J0H92_19285 [Sphingobacteriales bacterium]|nr:hypothetical protein [Sphingobacteriales bacterium]OJW32066.1 MAG: hypothetical protein BGO54_16765 [Sphingobacteriales bacterium 46-32]